MHKHEVIETGKSGDKDLPLLARTLVPGGWLYTSNTWGPMADRASLTIIATATTFVPFPPEEYQQLREAMNEFLDKAVSWEESDYNLLQAANVLRTTLVALKQQMGG